jgi:hypothetical protein
MASIGEVRKLRNAETELTITNSVRGSGHWRAARDRKTHTWFGEEPLEKYPVGQLVGGLLYRMRGFEAEADGAIRSSTVTGRAYAVLSRFFSGLGKNVPSSGKVSGSLPTSKTCPLQHRAMPWLPKNPDGIALLRRKEINAIDPAWVPGNACPKNR